MSRGDRIGEWGDRRLQSRPPSTTSVESVVANSSRTFLDGVCARPLAVGRGPSLFIVPRIKPFTRNQWSVLSPEAPIVGEGECQFGHRHIEGLHSDPGRLTSDTDG